MNRKRPDVDVILDLLKDALVGYPKSNFIESLLFQYQERGSLSKKQLEGLYQKAANLKTISPGKLATLEAIILKKPTRYKSPDPTPVKVYTKDKIAGELISAILEKYPNHKRVVFYNLKYNNNEEFSAAERSEIEKFYKLLVS